MHKSKMASIMASLMLTVFGLFGVTFAWFTLLIEANIKDINTQVARTDITFTIEYYESENAGWVAVGENFLIDSAVPEEKFFFRMIFTSTSQQNKEVMISLGGYESKLNYAGADQTGVYYNAAEGRRYIPTANYVSDGLLYVPSNPIADAFTIYDYYHGAVNLDYVFPQIPPFAGTALHERITAFEISAGTSAMVIFALEFDQEKSFNITNGNSNLYMYQSLFIKSIDVEVAS